MNSGIYCIENLINGKKYIGQAKDLKKRKREHFSTLRNGKNGNMHLQRSFNKYGEDAFAFKVLLYCDLAELTKYEQFFVDLYTPEKLYNNRLECVNSNLGLRWSDEMKIEQSKKLSGKNHPMYGKKGKEHYNFGKVRSEEFKKHLSIINSGKNHPMYGKTPSDYTRLKMSERKKGEKRKPFTQETLQKMSMAAFKREDAKRKTKNDKVKRKNIPLLKNHEAL